MTDPLSQSRIEIAIEHGTVLNPDAFKHPPPLLTNTLDSLATFPSMQRFQKRTIIPTKTTDQNANHLRSIHNRHEANARFLKIRRSPSADEEMLKAIAINLQSSQLDPKDRKLMGTTVASYLDKFHPEHYQHEHEHEQREEIPNGFVSKQRNFFTQQIATPVMALNNEERAIFSSENGGDEYSDKINKFNPSRRKSAPHNSEPKVTITGVTAVDPITPELPTSFYLLRQSQESLELKRKPRTASENAAISDRSPSYRTIIKFSKNREIIPESVERPIPHAVLKPGEVVSRSTPFVEKTSPQPRNSPTPDLLRVIKFPGESLNGEPLSPSTIRNQCDEIYRIVQNHGSRQAYSEGPESGYNTLKEAPPLTRMQSNGSFGESSPPTYGGGLPPMQHPLQVDFSPPEPYKPHPNIHEIENKKAEIERLQRELYDAQVCNYRLNAQMGQLVSKDWKREESVLKKNLKDKTAEIENLKKRLEKAERDRRNLESKQPPNVQHLQGEKRELQIALEREESEKHELFMQINQLIAELADLRGNASDNAAAKELKEEIDQLRGKLQTAEHERDEIRKSISSLEAAKNAAQEELFMVNNELEKVKLNAEMEKQKFRQEITEHQKEVQVKSAALQSLRLAKSSEPSTSAEEFDRVVQEKDQLSRELEAKKREIQELSRNENDKQKALEISEAKIKNLEKDLTEFRSKVETIQDELDRKAQEIENFQHQLHSSNSSASAQVQELQEKFDHAQKKISQLEQTLDLANKNSSEIENEAAEMEERLAQAEETIDELNNEIKKFQESGKNYELRIMNELQMAKESIENREKEIEVERKKVKESEESMKKVREELDNHKNEMVSLTEDLQKRSTEIIQHNSTITELQTRITQLEKENNKLMEKASVEEELMTLVNSLQEARARISSKENEVHELRQKLMEQQDETDKVSSELRQTLSALERAEEECKKFAETDVELAEYRRESERKLEEVRRELNEEIVKAKSETNKLQSELESNKKTISKMENEIRDLAMLGETRLEKLRSIEMEKGRLETKLMEYDSEIESLQDELSRLEKNKSEASESEEKELLKVREALKTAESSLKINESEKHKLESELREIKSQAASNFKEAQEAKGLIASLEARISQIQSERDSMENDLIDAQKRFHGSEVSKDSEISILKKELADKESQLVHHKSKEAAHAQATSDARASIAALDARISQIESEKDELEKELHEAQKRHHGNESSKDSEISKLKENLEDKETQLQQLTNTALELDVVRSSFNELHSKVGVMEQEKTILADKLQETKNKLERKEEELEAEQNAAISKMGNREAELKQDLERIKREKENTEAELKNQKELVVDLKRSHDRLNENLQRLTELMAADGKRVDSMNREKETLVQEKHELAESLRKTQEKIRALEDEIEEVKAASHPSPIGDDAELRRKISELTEENARLAGDLLKQSSRSGDDDAKQLRTEFERALQEKQRTWTQEKQSLVQRLEEQENDIHKLNQSKVDLETDLQRHKMLSSYNDSLTPVPKPRRANTSLTNLTMDAMSERSITPTADEEECKKLRTELDKQKRIVTVLRKKLQQQQVETLRQNKMNSSATSASPSFH